MISKFRNFVIAHRWELLPMLMLFAMWFAIGWAAHRPAAPRIEYRDRLVTKTVTVEREQQKIATTEATAEQRQRVTHRTETIHADGTKVITFDTASQMAARVDVRQLEALNLSSSSTTTATRTVQLEQAPSSPPRWKLSALAGLSTRGPVYGGALSYRLLGPVSVGAWGLTAPAAGVSLSVEW